MSAESKRRKRRRPSKEGKKTVCVVHDFRSHSSSVPGQVQWQEERDYIHFGRSIGGGKRDTRPPVGSAKAVGRASWYSFHLTGREGENQVDLGLPIRWFDGSAPTLCLWKPSGTLSESESIVS